MVFVRTKRGADRLVSQLKREACDAAAIHGDLRQTARETALRTSQTNAQRCSSRPTLPARGIHVDDVDVRRALRPARRAQVVLHRSGRTARAGNEGIVVTFVLWNQELDVESCSSGLGIPRTDHRGLLERPSPRDLGRARLAGAAQGSSPAS
jgi:superfamily II DNA/RNA helicase